MLLDVIRCNEHTLEQLVAGSGRRPPHQRHRFATPSGLAAGARVEWTYIAIGKQMQDGVIAVSEPALAHRQRPGFLGPTNRRALGLYVRRNSFHFRSYRRRHSLT